MLIEKKSILSRSRQAWKYRIMLVAFWIAVTVIVASWFLSTSQWQFESGLIIGGIIALIGGIFPFTIRCPKCRSRWYWHALKTPVGGYGLEMLFSKKTCPNCGFSKNTESEKEQK